MCVPPIPSQHQDLARSNFASLGGRGGMAGLLSAGIAASRGQTISEASGFKSSQQQQFTPQQTSSFLGTTPTRGGRTLLR